jgi:hypothetical protein
VSAGLGSAPAPLLHPSRTSTLSLCFCCSSWRERSRPPLSYLVLRQGRATAVGARHLRAHGREPLGEHLGVKGEDNVVAWPVNDDQLGDLH